MENGLLDRVEGKANVHRWSEQTQLGKGDSITVGYMSELSDYTRISVTQNNLQELKAIWDQWGNETKQSFYGKYRDFPYLFDIQVDENLFRALAQFWNPAYSCFTFGEVDLVPTVEEYTALLWCSRFQCDRIYSRAACVPTFGKKLMTITGMSEQWIMMRRPRISSIDLANGYFCSCDFGGDIQVFFEDYSLLKDIAASTRRVDVFEKNWTALLQNLQPKDVEWRAPWMIPGEILYRCGSFDWGAIGYTPLLVLRQHGLRQFIPVIYGLVQSEFAYRGANYKRKGVAISPITTPEYVEWRGRRINDNIPKPSVEGARLMEEYLQVTPSELEIMKQEFERKNLELEKRIAKLEEEKIYLSLDVNRAKIGGSLDQLQKEVRGEKSKAEYWERKFQELEAREDHLKEELRQSKEQVRDRDYLIGEAIIQIR
ncbi:hypothetical protein CXB51_016096 [Gossypium anomalum]|uniref:DUF7745 domain-containing protein n=1 Tax=Gossypium anomalum TaxID=47600 RepID=A0A8J5Z2V0_9ROSI|nr:hypothetical protein CXB51_016096 [Gossypium anomalum]